MPSNGAQTATTKRKSTRVKKNRWHEDSLMTNADSPLVNIDLVKLLSDPKAWLCLDEEDKKQILALLPESVHPHHEPGPDGTEAPIPPLSQEFLRYSNAWRDGIRQVQTDLGNGKYEPQWQRRANEASRERADGDFDKWKEDEFEEFWGQKQKVDSTIRSGESAGVKLKTLVENGAVRIGDIWRYSCFRRVGGKKILVEKEVLVTNWNGSSLTFAIPPGQRVVISGDLKQMLEVQSEVAPESPVQNPSTESTEQISDEDLTTQLKQHGTDQPQHPEQSEQLEQPQPEHPTIEQPSGFEDFVSQLNDAAAGDDQSERKEIELADNASQRQPTAESDAVHLVGEAIPGQNGSPALNGDRSTGPDAMSIDEPAEPVIPESSQPATVEDECPNGDENKMDVCPKQNLDTIQADPDTTDTAEPDTKPDIKSKITPEMADAPIILAGVTGPARLARKIHEIDGRCDYNTKNNAWRSFRCLRMNQDMGSLWDLRQGWHCRSSDE